MLKLFHSGELIGTITDELADGLAVIGQIQLTPAAQRFRKVFEFFADEERGDNEDPPFPDELLYSWYIELVSGEREEISIPNIYPDGLICWR